MYWVVRTLMCQANAVIRKLWEFNPDPANMEKGELLIMPANGRWDLTKHLKG